MADLTRVSISLETALLDAFDRFLAAKGYETRSEAIRDLIRDRLIKDQAEHVEGEQVAIVTLVYDHHARELAARLIDKQHHHHDLVVSSLHVHLGERHCLEVSVLRGPAGQVRHLGDELLATKGVLHGDLLRVAGRPPGLLADEVIADQVADGLAARRVAPALVAAVEGVQQGAFQGDADAGQFGHVPFGLIGPPGAAPRRTGVRSL